MEIDSYSCGPNKICVPLNDKCTTCGILVTIEIWVLHFTLFRQIFNIAHDIFCGFFKQYIEIYNIVLVFTIVLVYIDFVVYCFSFFKIL